ncbi:MAG: NAD-dependent epimerase/dehydratase family protein, partial [Betaproteobacteria bacterium]
MDRCCNGGACTGPTAISTTGTARLESGHGGCARTICAQTIRAHRMRPQDRHRDGRTQNAQLGRARAGRAFEPRGAHWRRRPGRAGPIESGSTQSASAMRHSNILVLGGSGFVGRYIVNALVARGCRVIVPARRRDRAKHLILLPTCEVVQANIHDDATLERLLAGQHAVINLVGILQGSEAQFERAHHALARRRSASGVLRWSSPPAALSTRALEPGQRIGRDFDAPLRRHRRHIGQRRRPGDACQR